MNCILPIYGKNDLQLTTTEIGRFELCGVSNAF